MKQVSVIIPALNEEKYISLLIQSLDGLNAVGEIIVVDGASTDQTRTIVAKWIGTSSHSIRLFTSPKANTSFQRNLGAQNARFDWLLFMDADAVVVDPAALTEFIRQAQEDRCDAAIPRYISTDGGWRAWILYAYLHVFHRVMQYIMPYALGACILTTRSMFNAVHGFREDLAMNEDAHYVTVVRRNGLFKVYSQPIGVSARRFERLGYIRMCCWYAGAFLWRSIVGDSTNNPFTYVSATHDE